MKKLDLSITQRLAIGFLVVLGLVLGQVALSATLSGRIEREEHRMRTVVLPRLHAASELESALLGKAIALRTAILVPHPDSRRRNEEATVELRAKLDTLARYPKSPAGEALFEQVRTELGAYLQEADRFTARSDLASPDLASSEPPAAEVERELSRRRDRVLERLEAFSDLQRTRVEQGQSEVARMWNAMRRAYLVLSAIILFAIALSGFGTVRSLREPALALVEASRALSRGDYGPALALPAAAGPPRRDEIQELTVAFRDAAQALQERSERLQAQNEELQAQGEEIQAQSEELQAQSEEIQAQNEELQAQREELQVQNEELQARNEELQQVGEQLRLKSEALAEADRRKDQFLAMLGHELRNPLAGISNAGQLLDRVCGPGESCAPACGKYRAIVNRQAKHLGRLVNDLLDLSRVTQDKISLERRPVDLRAVIDGAAACLRGLVEERRHVLSFELPEQPAMVDGDAVRLEQVVTNLLHNAAKYTEPGGHITVSLEREAAQWALRVRDDGIGISPDLLPRVFDLFTQADDSLARSHGGLGIGLTLVRRLVELHGGKIDARSPGAGGGSEFVVRLPISAPEATEPEAAPVASRFLPDVRERAGLTPGMALDRERASTVDSESRRSQSSGRAEGLKVLVVDDNRDISDSLAEIVSIFGHQPRVASHAEAALASARAEPPDVALLDIGLPDLDGCELARRLQALVPGLRLVAMTGYGLQEDRQRTREAGFELHMVKPVNPDELQGALAVFESQLKGGRGG